MDMNDNTLNGATPVILATDDRKKRKQEIEEEQEEIRTRIRKTKAAPNAVLLPADPQPTIHDDAHKRVAAYARVSTSNTEQLSSIEYQRKWYEELISKNPNWEMCAIYSDEGKSGTSMKKRPEFRRMIQDANNGEIDLIICASVSRFARNVSDCIEQVDLLKTQDPTHPVGVFFESENIYTLNANSNQAFQMHSMLADWESATKSSRMILSYDQRITMGQYPVSDLLGFRHTKDGKLIIQPDEAITVKYIFYARLIGKTFQEIADVLTEKARPTLTGKTVWDSGMVAEIMKNERRWGDLEARKVVVLNYKKGKTAKNTYIKDGIEHHHRCGAIVQNHHEGIVTPEIAKAAHMVVTTSLGGGVSDICVIDKGALKGFVNIAPWYNAVDSATFVDACSSVYSDDEFMDIQTEADIRTGNEHSKMSTIDFYDYEVPHSAFFISSSTANITISKKGIKLNKKVIDRFGSDSFLEILYHPILQLLALRVGSSSNPNAFPLTSDDGKIIQNISAPGLCRSIYEQMDWINSFCFRMRGVYRERNGFQLMLFYLDETQIIPDRATKEKYKETENHSHTHYIPYHNYELSLDIHTARKEAIDLGIPMNARIKRDELINTITGNDIQQQGSCVLNTKTGAIPSRKEVLAELDKLLLSM